MLAKPSPSLTADLQGFGRHLPWLPRKPAAQDPAPSRKEPPSMLSMGVRPELELTGGDAVPRSSRAARGRR